VNQLSENKTHGIFMPFGSCQAGRIDADGHLPIAVSRPKASQIGSMRWLRSTPAACSAWLPGRRHKRYQKRDCPKDYRTRFQSGDCGFPAEAELEREADQDAGGDRQQVRLPG
jgi:hypothetical protein